jgi:hypothetical protein
VSEGEKQWLYSHTSAVIYPTTYEGFGLVPFEAAAAGAPCVFAPQASLTEVLPTELASIVPWDVAASAANTIALLRSDERRGELVAGIRAAGTRFTWRASAARSLDCYWEAAKAAPRPIPDIAPGHVAVNEFGWEVTPFWKLPLKTISVLRERGLRGLGPHVRGRLMHQGRHR